MSAEERITQLEQEVAALKKAVGSLPMALSDREGRKRIEMLSERNDTAIRFFTAEGNVALSIGVDGSDCGYVSIRNAAGKIVAKLDVEQYGARLELLDSHFGSAAAVVAHGNDCDNDGGWIKVLCASGDDEVMICCEEGPDGT